MTVRHIVEGGRSTISKTHQLTASHGNGFWTADHVLVVCNVALVVATMAMAWASLRQARATTRGLDTANAQLTLGQKEIELAERQIAVATRDVDAAVRPLIVDLPLGVDLRRDNWGTHDAAKISFRRGQTKVGEYVSAWLPLRNIGPGPAFIRDASLWVDLVEIEARVSRRVVANYETTIISLRIVPGETGYEQLKLSLTGKQAVMTVWVAYTDLAGGQLTQTRVELAWPDPPDHPVVHHVDLYAHTGTVWEGKPFASSGPADGKRMIVERP